MSAAYHDLLDRGWLELRRGSGLFVRPLQRSGTEGGELDALLTNLLRVARSLGHEPEQVLHRLEQLILPRVYARILVVEPEPGMREILLAEIEEHLRIPVEAIDPSNLSSISAVGGCLAAALATRAVAVRERLPRVIPFITLRLRSVGGSLEGQARPAPNAIIAIVSKSPEFRQGYCVSIDADQIAVTTKDRRVVKIARKTLSRLELRRSKGHQLSSLRSGMRKGLRTGFDSLLSPLAPYGIVAIPATLAWGAVAAPFCLLGDLKAKVTGTQELKPI